jgi:hypothetical protein
MRIDAHARAGGQVESLQRAARRPGPALRVERLSVDAPLDRKARGCGGSASPGRSSEALPAATAICNCTRSSPVTSSVTVFDLQTRVGLDEYEGSSLELSSIRNSNVPRLQ